MDEYDALRRHQYRTEDADARLAIDPEATLAIPTTAVETIWEPEMFAMYAASSQILHLCFEGLVHPQLSKDGDRFSDVYDKNTKDILIHQLIKFKPY